MKLIGVGMTTSVDRHGDCFTRNALLQAQALMNGPACLSVGLEHDYTVPSLGKIIAAEIRDRPAGVTELVLTQEIFDQESWATLPDGTVLFKAESDTDRRPFRTPTGRDETELSVDPNSLPAGTSPEAFFQIVAAEHGVAPFVPGTHFRKSMVPDPELAITIGKLFVAGFLGKKLIDKVVERVGEVASEDAVKLYRLVRTAIITFARYPWNRPVCYILQLPGDPFIEFVAKTSSPQRFLDALAPAQCGAAVEQALSLDHRFGVSRVQFLLDEHGKGEFNFLLTRDGAVIGTEASYARRGVVLRGFVERATAAADADRRLSPPVDPE